MRKANFHSLTLINTWSPKNIYHVSSKYLACRESWYSHVVCVKDQQLLRLWADLGTSSESWAHCHCSTAAHSQRWIFNNNHINKVSHHLHQQPKQPNKQMNEKYIFPAAAVAWNWVSNEVFCNAANVLTFVKLIISCTIATIYEYNSTVLPGFKFQTWKPSVEILQMHSYLE